MTTNKPILKNSSGMTLVESLISFALLATVAVSISPVFVSSGKVSKGSNIREVCQRFVNAKINSYRAMTSTQLLARYNAYRAANTDVTSVSGSPWNKLCGYHEAQTFSTAFPATAPAPTGVPEAALQANIVTYGTGTYGDKPALGIRECVQFNGAVSNEAADTFTDTASPYPATGCITRAGDQAAVAAIPGFKMYVSMSVMNPWGGTQAYSCPASTYAPTGLNESIDIRVSVAADYSAAGLTDAAGEKDPNRLLCSARATVPIVSASNTGQFRYYAHSPDPPAYPTPGSWTIRKIGDGIGSGDAVYTPVSNQMNTWTPRPSAGVNGVVTQFGISPSGTRAFFVKAYEQITGSDVLTSYYCTMSISGETDTSNVTPTCFVLPRRPDNQIEYVVLDYQGGKIWGITGRSADPDRPVGGGAVYSQDIDSVVLVADCSTNNTTPQTREAALFTLSNCASSPVAPTAASGTVYSVAATSADFDTRKLDLDYLSLSPDAMWGASPNPAYTSLNRTQHIPVRSLRDIKSMFSNDGLFYKVFTDTATNTVMRDCISLQPTPGAKVLCTRNAYARLFFSPDALSAYAVMRYPNNANTTTDPGVGSSTVTCPGTSAYTLADQTVRIYKLELPNASGSTNNSYSCPNVVASYQVPGLWSGSSNYKHILISF